MWLKTYLTCGFACSEYPASVLRNSGLRRCGSKIHLTCGSRSSSRCQQQCTISNEHGNDKAACEKHSLQSKAMQGTRVAVFLDTMFCMKSRQESRLASEVPCGPAKQQQSELTLIASQVLHGTGSTKMSSRALPPHHANTTHTLYILLQKQLYSSIVRMAKQLDRVNSALSLSKELSNCTMLMFICKQLHQNGQMPTSYRMAAWATPTLGTPARE